MARQRRNAVVQQIAGSPSGNIVHDHGQPDIRHLGEVFNQTSLGRFHVVGSDDQVGIGSHINCLLSHLLDSFGVDGASANQERDFPLHVLDDRVQDYSAVL